MVAALATPPYIEACDELPHHRSRRTRKADGLSIIVGNDLIDFGTREQRREHD